MKPKAVVLLSGGLDSATAFAVARDRGFAVFALSVDYGQRHRVELEKAAAVAKALGATDHRTVKLDLRAIGGSALTADVAVPKDRSADDMDHGIPVTYVPARNTILLGLALGYAETVGAFDIFIGANVLDYSGYPDCRPEFLERVREPREPGDEGRSGRRGEVPRPLAAPQDDEGRDHPRRRESRRRLRADAELLRPRCAGRACGRCDSCLLRKKGFTDAGITDPTVYQASASGKYE